MRKKIALLIAMCLGASLVFTACSSETETEVSEASEESAGKIEVETEGPAEIAETSYDPSGFISDPDDFYVLEGSENMDYEEGLLYDTDIVTDIIVDDSDVDLSAPGVYTVVYTVIVDDDALGEEPIDDILIYRTVEVVDDDRAVELAAEGKLIWGSNNSVVEICGTEDAPLYMRYTVEDITDDVATLLIENYIGEEITCSLCFDLEAEKDDDWIRLERQGDDAFEDAEYILEDQSEAEIKCDLSPYGELADGNYRIVTDGVYVEFTIENGVLADTDEIY